MTEFDERMPAEPGSTTARRLLTTVRVLWVLAGASVAGPLLLGALPIDIPIWITTLPTLLALSAIALWAVSRRTRR
ncbi:hypothetical protein ACEXQB_012910 [Herbiconiux sp. P18]|uniref:hypothetical protein n=1 Tax=Herbiconiux liangxiaofengii TaxID=3342795 RepID=UPI0035B7D00E